MMLNREMVYRVLHSCSNRFGAIDRSQQEMADLLDISYQQLSIIYKEFIEMGMLEKDKHKFMVLYDPDKIPWGEKYDALRKKHIETNGAINRSKEKNDA